MDRIDKMDKTFIETAAVCRQNQLDASSSARYCPAARKGMERRLGESSFFQKSIEALSEVVWKS